MVDCADNRSLDSRLYQNKNAPLEGRILDGGRGENRTLHRLFRLPRIAQRFSAQSSGNSAREPVSPVLPNTLSFALHGQPVGNRGGAGSAGRTAMTDQEWTAEPAVVGNEALMESCRHGKKQSQTEEAPHEGESASGGPAYRRKDRAWRRNRRHAGCLGTIHVKRRRDEERRSASRRSARVSWLSNDRL